MELIFPILIGAVILGASLYGSNDWKEIAKKLGLEYSNFFQRSMYGTIDGFKISIEQQKHHIDILVKGPTIRKTLTLDKEGFLNNILGGQDIEIGCPSFDARTYIANRSRNSEAVVSALLDEKTRNAVSRFVVKGGAKVADGKITHARTNEIKRASKVIDGLFTLAAHLKMDNAEIPTRLATNALKDSVSSVRLRNLTLLQENFSSSSEATTTSAALLADPCDSIRLAAAMFVGKDGLSAITDIAQSSKSTVDLRIKALQHLARKNLRENFIGIADALLNDKDERLQRVVIKSLGTLQHRPALDSIIALLDAKDVATVLEIIKAIEKIGDTSAEEALVGLLEHTNNRVKTAAIGALAKVGTITAVEPLHLLTKRLGLKRSAREAIDSIQSRLGDVESGRLSLAPAVDPLGALSLADDPEKAGGLSLDEQDH